MISPILNSAAATEYLGRISATMKTLFTAVITRTSMGYERDVAVIRFRRDGTVVAPEGLEPTAAESEAMRIDISAMTFPTQVTLSALPTSGLPKLIEEATTDQLFIYRDKKKQIRFIQVRVELENGDKRYVPQTYWSDSQWRALEPESGLPLYNADLVYSGARVFVHEGAKAARAATEICDDPSHPWQEYFATGVHIGWIGGAHHLHRNLWGEVATTAGEVIIVPDNDFVGKFRVRDLSRKFNCPTYFMQFDNRWPRAWDAADPLPEEFFSADTGIYQGPEVEDLLVNCIWATEEIPTEGNRPAYGIREEFAQHWVRIQQLKHYADIRQPEFTMDKDQFNIRVRPYSDVQDTANVLAKASGHIVEKVTFAPDMPSGLVSVDGQLCLNQYVDRRIKPYAGMDTGPFWRFMEYLIPDPLEREHVVRWMATVYAQPQTRLNYGILFLSKLQGVGKSTLLNIMAELVGKKHTSFPGDAMVQSDFNGWIVNKRLVCVHEIYAGQNWKTYNRLKSLITDEYIEANNKHVANYTIPNWTHYMAASNSMEALRMEHDDRRWLVPKLPETLYDNYEQLVCWIRSGGLKSLASELMKRTDYLNSGDRAPHTVAKMELIDQSMPTDERTILLLCERLGHDQCMDIKEVWLWAHQELKGKAFVSPQKIGSVLRQNGYQTDPPKQLGTSERLLVWRSPEAKRKLLENVDPANVDTVTASCLVAPSAVFNVNQSM